MARVRGPLFSASASGTIGMCLTYQKILYVDAVRANPFKSYSRSQVQDIVRRTLTWSLGYWHTMEWNTKQLWYNFRDYKGLSGYHAWLRQFLNQTYKYYPQFEAPPYFGYCITGNHITGKFLSGGDYLTPPT